MVERMRITCVQNRLQRKTANVVFAIFIKAVGTFVLHLRHGIVIGEVTFEFIVLGNGLAPFPLVTESFSNEKNRTGCLPVVVRETFQHTGTFFDDFVVLLCCFTGRHKIRIARKRIRFCLFQFHRFFVIAVGIKNMIQISAARTAFKHHRDSERHQGKNKGS